ESEGSLADPASELRLRCRGTGPCESSAQRCSRNDWRDIPGADDVRLPASFFLPPGGLAPAGSAASAARTATPEPGSAAQTSDRGATLSFDNLNILVNKDV